MGRTRLNAGSKRLRRVIDPAKRGAPSEDIVKRQEIVVRLAARHGAALVHFQTALDRATERAPAEHWIWDDIHPTYSGHQILADEWERTVRDFWK